MNEDYALRCSVIGCDAQFSHDDSSIDRIKKCKVCRVFLWHGVAQQHATNSVPRTIKLFKAISEHWLSSVLLQERISLPQLVVLTDRASEQLSHGCVVHNHQPGHLKIVGT